VTTKHRCFLRGARIQNYRLLGVAVFPTQRSCRYDRRIAWRFTASVGSVLY